MKKMRIVAVLTFIVFMLSAPVSLYGKNLKWKKYRYGLQSVVTGSVECYNTQPVSRALVYLAGESYMAKTDDEGRFRLNSVRPGNYTLDIEAPNTSAVPLEIEIRGHQTVDLGVINVECTATPAACQDSSDCAPDEYCEKTNSLCGSEGTCVVNDIICPEVYTPVCGCNGTTYVSECWAKTAGVNVRYQGVCDNY